MERNKKQWSSFFLMIEMLLISAYKRHTFNVRYYNVVKVFHKLYSVSLAKLIHLGDIYFAKFA
jgi:hypothetical protein